MGIRETLNKNPSIVTGVTIGIIVIAIGFIIWQLATSGAPNMANAKSFYTIDDGATRFSDYSSKLPPFDYKGQQAVRVYVYQCADKKPFIAYMERYTPEAKAVLEKAKADPANINTDAVDEAMNNGIEIKKPGGEKWVRRESPEGQKLTSEIKCPDGTLNNIEPVIP